MFSHLQVSVQYLLKHHICMIKEQQSLFFSSSVCHLFLGCMEEWITVAWVEVWVSLKWLTVNPTYGNFPHTLLNTLRWMPLFTTLVPPKETLSDHSEMRAKWSTRARRWKLKSSMNCVVHPKTHTETSDSENQSSPTTHSPLHPWSELRAKGYQALLSFLFRSFLFMSSPRFYHIFLWASRSVRQSGTWYGVCLRWSSVWSGLLLAGIPIYCLFVFIELRSFWLGHWRGIISPILLRKELKDLTSCRPETQ